jgi:glycosyltransferase involved in cell wall biosynthesis
MITVIIIFLNAEQYLQEAIDSVCRQTATDWELILIDDGSTDSSTNIAKDACNRQANKIYYAHHPNHATLGTSASRNLGLNISRGDLVTFLDSDDILFPESLELRSSEILARPNVGAVFGPMLFLHCDPLYDQAVDSLQDLSDLENMEISAPFLLIEILHNEGIHPGNNSILFRKSVALQVGGFESDFKSMYEDTVFIAKLFLVTSVYVSPVCTSIYRLHWKSLCHQTIRAESHDPHRRRLKEPRRAFLEWLERYLAARPKQSLRLRLILFFQLWPYRSSMMRVIGLTPNNRFAAGMVRVVTRGLVFWRGRSNRAALSRTGRLNRTLLALTKVEEFYRETHRPVEPWQFKRRRDSIEASLLA